MAKRRKHDTAVGNDAKPFRLKKSKLPSTAASLAALAASSLFYAPELLFEKWFWLLLPVVLVVLGIVHLFTRTQVDVGLDGVLIRKGWSKRFVDHDDIVEVESATPTGRFFHHVGVRLTLRSGETIELPTHTGRTAKPGEDVLAEALEEARHRRQHDESHAQRLVLPGARDARAWLAALRQISHREDYRRSFVAPETLAAVVDDPRAPAAARAGAALALESTQGEGRGRLRIAAEATADPDQRSQLRRIADADEEAEIEAALEELAAAHREREARESSA